MPNRPSVLALLVLSLAACSPKADLVVTGGLVWTGLSSGNPQPGAVAVRGGKIFLVGDSVAIAPLIGPRTQRVDARGGLVLPGFADGHTHFISGGVPPAPGDPREAPPPPGVFPPAQEEAHSLKPRGGVLGGGWGDTLWACADLPPRPR